MIDSDKVDFKKLMDATSDYYQKDPLTGLTLKMYFAALERFSLDQVKHAISRHIQEPSGGQFYPKAADIVRHIEGSRFTTDEIIAQARLKNTPLGILCWIQIGSWDLMNQTDMFYIKQRAEECLQRMPEWLAKASQGDYTDHEISVMLKHGVSPMSPFANGLPTPGNQQALSDRINSVSHSERHRRLMKPAQKDEGGDAKANFELAENVKEFIKKEMNSEGDVSVSDSGMTSAQCLIALAVGGRK